MLAKQRYTKILELLDKDGIVHTAELVKLMGVSSETVRKDLEYLDNQGRLSRVHGGAVPVDNGTTPAEISHHGKGGIHGGGGTDHCIGLWKHQPDDGADP